MMQSYYRIIFLAAVLFLSSCTLARADSYTEATEVFRQAPAVEAFFKDAYGYAIFPHVGKGGMGLGGAYGKGKVYVGDKVTGTANLIKATFGFQLGGQVFSEIIFFQDKRAYDEFTNGAFEFDATASAVAITVGAHATVGTQGASAGATTGPKTKAQAKTRYNKGMAVFTYAIGGLMYEAVIGGQAFHFTPN